MSLVFEHDLSINRIIVPDSLNEPRLPRCEDLSDDGKHNIDFIQGTEIPNDRLVRVVAGETVRCYDITTLKEIVNDAEALEKIPKDPFTSILFTPEQIQWIKSIEAERPAGLAEAREAGNRQRQQDQDDFARDLQYQNGNGEEEEEESKQFDIGIDSSAIAEFDYNNYDDDDDYFDRRRTGLLQRHADSIIWKVLMQNDGIIILSIFQNTLVRSSSAGLMSDEKYASAQFKLFRFLMDQMNIRNAGVVMVLEHFHYFFNMYESPSFLKFCGGANSNTQSLILKMIHEMFGNIDNIVNNTSDLIHFLKAVDLCLISMRMPSIKKDDFWCSLLKKWLIERYVSNAANSFLYAFYKSEILGDRDVFAEWLFSFFMYEYIPSVMENQDHIYASLSKPEALSRIFRGKYDLFSTIFYDNTYRLKLHIVKGLFEHLISMSTISEEGYDLSKWIISKRPNFITILGNDQHSQILREHQKGTRLIEKKIFKSYDKINQTTTTNDTYYNNMEVKSEQDVFMAFLKEANSDWVFKILMLGDGVEHKADFVKEQMMFLVSTYNITKKFMTLDTETDFILSYIDNMSIDVNIIYLPYYTIVHDLFISVIKNGTDDHLRAIFNPGHYNLLQKNLYRTFSIHVWKVIFKYLLIIREQTKVVKDIQHLLIESTADMEYYTHNWKDINDVCFENMRPRMIFLKKYMYATPDSSLKLSTLRELVGLLIKKIKDSSDSAVAYNDVSVDQESVDCVKIICDLELQWYREDETGNQKDYYYEDLINGLISTYDEAAKYYKRSVNKYIVEIFEIVKASIKRAAEASAF